MKNILFTISERGRETNLYVLINLHAYRIRMQIDIIYIVSEMYV